MADLSGVKEVIAGIKDKATRLGAAIDALQGKAQTAQADIDDLKARADEVSASLDELIADAEGDTGTDVPAEGETPPTTQSFTKKA